MVVDDAKELISKTHGQYGPSWLPERVNWPKQITIQASQDSDNDREGHERDFQDCSQFGELHTISITGTVQPKENSQNPIMDTTFYHQLEL